MVQNPSSFLKSFGDEIDIVIFDQLFGYTDETSCETFEGGALDHSSKPTSYGGLKMMMKFGSLMKDVSQPTDEVTFFHKKSGLVIEEHNYQFFYSPMVIKHLINLKQKQVHFL